jgi:hypothetical protein
MIKWIKNIFKSRKKYEEKIAELEQKLVEKQEHINKTNAFWKKKMYNSKKNNKL